MNKATQKEREDLIRLHGLTRDEIDTLEIKSYHVRRGIPVDFRSGLAVVGYQKALQKVRKSNRRWWEFWK